MITRTAAHDDAPALQLSVAKSHLRVSGGREDDDIRQKSWAVCDALEATLGVVPLEATFRHDRGHPVNLELDLPRYPATAVDSVKLVCTDGTEVDVDSADYHLVKPATVRFASDWMPDEPAGKTFRAIDPLRIAFDAGVTDDVDEIPQTIKQYLLLYLTLSWVNRPGLVEDSLSADGQLAWLRKAIVAEFVP